MDSSISAMVLDSPFTDLDSLSLELAKSKTGLPAFILKGVLSLIKSKIEELAEFKLSEVNVMTK